MSDRNVVGMLACSKCGKTFKPPAFSFDAFENKRRKRRYFEEVRAHMRQCYPKGGNGNGS